MRVTARIKARALELGFDAVAVAALAPLEAQSRYEAWLAAGRHGDMRWLANEKHRGRRADPTRLLRDLASVVCVALCHPAEADAARDARLGRIARYAVGEDYHRVMDDLLGTLERDITAMLPGSRALWYADTGAILERGWAERAGLGWIGKHSGLLSRERWLVVPARRGAGGPSARARRAAGREHCGSCTRCLDVCPTRAIVAPYQVDARLCISYLTIEHKGALPLELRPLIGDWIFGCDVCQEVCPWNRFAPQAGEARLHARDLADWSLERFLSLDETAFRSLFATSAIRRADREGFLRNVCVALGNRAEATAAPALSRSLATDPAPLVRGHAAWALGEIARRAGSAPIAKIVASLRGAADDPDGSVRDEARGALARLEC